MNHSELFNKFNIYFHCLQYTSIKKSDVEELQTKYEQLLLKIRPNAVGLVDAFDYPDEVILTTKYIKCYE